MNAKRTSCLVCLSLWPWLATGFVASGLLGCNSIIGLDQFAITGGAGGKSGGVTGGSAGDMGTGGSGGGGGSSATGGSTNDGGLDASEEARVVDCHTNRECTDRATAAAMARAADAGSDAGGAPLGAVPAVCVQPEGKCVELLTVDCKTITGDYLNDSSIMLGSLFSTVGAQAATNVQRQQSATLAIEQINDPAVGGIPAPGGKKRPLLMVSCDEATNVTRAGTHLINDLHVPAIVGPNTSQDTLDLSNRISVQGGTVLITPSAVASSIPDLIDMDLTWLMAPSDVQRAPLMIQQINALEAQLNSGGKSPVKLGIIYRNDALGKGTASALNALVLNGKPLTDPTNFGTNVQIDFYDPALATQDAIVAKYQAFAPDIVVLAGTAEAVTKVMNPLETAWAGAVRPSYVTIDSVKVPELLAAAANADLRGRIRGTGITPGADSDPVFSAFKVAYATRYSTPTMPNQQPTASSTGPSYDAAYAIAYALATIQDLPITGANIALGLRKLAGGTTVIQVGATKALAAFQHLSAGEKITGIGTFGPLEWDQYGAVVGGTLEMWCIGVPNNVPTYLSSKLYYDIKSKQFSGTYTQCP